MSELTFVSHNEGVSKESNKPYNVLTVNDGKMNFPLFLPTNGDVEVPRTLEEGDVIEVEVELYGGNDRATGKNQARFRVLKVS